MFHDARLKLDRANKHIEDIKSTILSAPFRSVGSVETHVDTGGKSIKHELEGLDPTLVQLSLIAGDAVHNIRTSLDFAWVEILQHLNLPLTNFSKFPIVESAVSLDRILSDREIDVKSRTFCECMRSAIKPYPGGNDSLIALHKMDILDKHLLRLKLVPYGGIEGFKVRDENGVIHHGSTFHREIRGPFYLDLVPAVEIEDNGTFPFAIVFDEVETLSGQEISQGLFALLITAAHTLKLSEDALR